MSDKNNNGNNSITARVVRIRYSADDSPWKVVDVETEGKKATVVGELPDIKEGIDYEFQGQWQVHKRYGEQFRADSCYPIPPKSEKGMIAYLSSGLIRGIGPKTAKKIVDKFGEETFDVITDNPERLLEVSGIAEGKKEQLVNSFKKHENLQEVVTYITGLGLSANLAVRLFEEYGDRAISILNTNPYQLTEDVFGIGFKRADDIAKATGVDPRSPHRIQAALTYVLREGAHRRGHTYLPQEELLGKTSELLSQEMKRPEDVPTDDDIKGVMLMAESSGHLRIENESVYLTQYYRCETEVAQRLAQIYRSGTVTAPPADIMEETLKKVESRLDVTYAPEQKEAIRKAFASGIMVITGGPGTGKTTIVRGILETAEILAGGLEVLLAAPTGRAARRLNEVTGHPAKTIHRLLGYTFIDGMPMFKHDEDEPLQGDVLIIDETSMVDIELAHYLLKAVPETMRIIFVGDADQLPSVGPGNFLRDLVSSDFLPVVRLTRIYRQDEVSDIVINAHRINKGELPKFQSDGGQSHFVKKSTPQDICDYVVRLVERMSESGNYSPFEFQVLSPMHRGPAGVANLNKEIQKRLNPPSPQKQELQAGGTTFRTGDKVMCLRNNYEKGQEGVFNGNLGTVEDIVSSDAVGVEETSLQIDFDGETVLYGRSELQELMLAYASTVHKSQGSEFPAVIMVLSTSHYILLQRNLFYTAATRAEDLLVLVGQPKAMYIAVQNNAVDDRYSRLSERLE